VTLAVMFATAGKNKSARSSAGLGRDPLAGPAELKMRVTGGDGPAIKAHGLAKRYGKQQALAGIDLVVRRGEVFGFLGPNGAGKTTTLRILATLTRPDAGTARVLGHDVVVEADAVRERVALTGQLASLDEGLTGQENLLMVGRLRGLSRRSARQRAEVLVETFGLNAASRRPVRGYSGGMRRRLDIAASLVVTPELLFLDEPTTGLDPRSRTQVWGLVREIATAGTTVLLTTQYLEEADQLAERIAVIDGGRIVAEGTSAQLKAKVGSAGLHVRVLDRRQRPEAQAVLGTALGTVVHLLPDPYALSARLSPEVEPTELGALVGRAMSELSRAQVALAEIALGHATLDEAFLALTGRPSAEFSTEEEDVDQ
jgi:ABC-2 type transport system ATP-binding protein